MTYVDAFVLPVPKDRIGDYDRICRQSAALWKEYGATAYFECRADDAPVGTTTSFPRSVQATDDETVYLSILVYPSREIRDSAMQRMMSDPRMKTYMDQIPTDGNRMFFGGFASVLDGADQS